MLRFPVPFCTDRRSTYFIPSYTPFFFWRELDFVETCQLALVSTFHIAVLLECGRIPSAKSHRMNLVKLLVGSVVEE
jgi:hypothetical protein